MRWRPVRGICGVTHPSGRAGFAAGFVFVRRRHARTRLFLRAEDVFGYTGRLTADIAELGEIEQDLAKLPEGPGRDRATAMARGERAALTRRYGANPDARSHGETFLALLQTRLMPNGLYFLDEPETPLSPTRVLALIALLVDRVRQGCQFVIATHSPILMAMPDATILLAEGGHLRETDWNDLEHVRVTRAFLADPAGAYAPADRQLISAALSIDRSPTLLGCSGHATERQILANRRPEVFGRRPPILCHAFRLPSVGGSR